MIGKLMNGSCFNFLNQARQQYYVVLKGTENAEVWAVSGSYVINLPFVWINNSTEIM